MKLSFRSQKLVITTPAANTDNEQTRGVSDRSQLRSIFQVYVANKLHETRPSLYKCACLKFFTSPVSTNKIDECAIRRMNVTCVADLNQRTGT